MDRPLELARASGLVGAGKPLLVMLSGGADSVCLLDVAIRLGARVRALHVNYGLRPGSDEDEAHCRALCERLGVPLIVERAQLAASSGPGNLQAEARRARYAHAERHSRLVGGDYATGHTATDQAETVLYRLAVSPGRRPLLGMPARRGRLVRPLLGVTREETHAYCRARELPWREDPSNVDRRFARARVREEVLPVLRELNPAVERNIAETSEVLRDESQVLERAVDEALEALGRTAVPLAELRARPRGLARLLLRRLAGEAGGWAPDQPGLALSRADADAILDLARSGGTASLDLGGGLRAVAEYGTLRFTRTGDPPPPEPVSLPIPGVARFGEWTVEARLGRDGEALLDRAALGEIATVRPWQDGDRMRPAGLRGTKSLQDLFTDRKVPRAFRRSLPVLEAGGEIAWVAGVAVSERFLAGEEAGDEGVVGVSARRGEVPEEGREQR